MSFTLAELLGRVPPRATPAPAPERPRCPVTGKVSYPTKAEALAVARGVNQHEVHCNRAYVCDWCRCVHLGRRGRRA